MMGYDMNPVFSPKSFLICVYPRIIIIAIGITENILYAIITISESYFKLIY